MNRAQLIVLWMGLAVIVAMLIVPPPGKVSVWYIMLKETEANGYSHVNVIPVKDDSGGKVMDNDGVQE